MGAPNLEQLVYDLLVGQPISIAAAMVHPNGPYIPLDRYPAPRTGGLLASLDIDATTSYPAIAAVSISRPLRRYV